MTNKLSSQTQRMEIALQQADNFVMSNHLKRHGSGKDMQKTIITNVTEINTRKRHNNEKRGLFGWTKEKHLNNDSHHLI